MKKQLIFLLIAALLLSIPGCSQPKEAESGGLNILCTTYPLYLFTTALCHGVDGITVEVMIDQSISCVHDYSLSVEDMKKLDAADMVITNGAGFEFFLSDLDFSDKTVVDCSTDVPLLPGEEGEYDPHIWLSPSNASIMTGNILEALSEALPDSESALTSNCDSYQVGLLQLEAEVYASLEGLRTRQLITFHDGFAYFAAAFDLDILLAMEEEAGSEASAADIAQIISLIEQYDLPAIFTETNGSTATAQAISRETGVKVASLNMLISSDGLEAQADPYGQVIRANANAIIEATEQ